MDVSHGIQCFSQLYEKPKYLQRHPFEIHLNEEEGIEKAVKEKAVNRLSRILEKLPEQQKNIMLHTIEGKTVKEIASLLSISENTVKTHKKRAYDIIRSKMTKDSDIILWMFIKTYL